MLSAARGKTWDDVSRLQLPRWLKEMHVPQAWFQHFYWVSVAWNLCWSALVLRAANVTGQGTKAAFWPELLLLGLLQLHFVRRMLESSFLAVYSPSARMHVVGYLVGISYYLAVPPSLVPVVPLACQREAQASSDSGSRQIRLWQILGLLLFALGSWRQCEAHRILARLRHPKGGSSAAASSADSAAARYQIPRGGWFCHVSCPHYLAEILIYAGLVLVGGTATLHAALLLTWVVSNLVVAARANHQWYKDHFQHYPKHRRAIIPWLL